MCLHRMNRIRLKDSEPGCNFRARNLQIESVSCDSIGNGSGVSDGSVSIGTLVNPQVHEMR